MVSNQLGLVTNLLRLEHKSFQGTGNLMGG